AGHAPALTPSASSVAMYCAMRPSERPSARIAVGSALPAKSSRRTQKLGAFGCLTSPAMGWMTRPSCPRPSCLTSTEYSVIGVNSAGLREGEACAGARRVNESAIGVAPFVSGGLWLPLMCRVYTVGTCNNKHNRLTSATTGYQYLQRFV